MSQARPHDTTLGDYFTCILPSSVLQEPKESGSTESCEASSLSLRTRQSTSIETSNRFEALMHAGDVAEDVQPQYYNQQHGR
eukprot:g83114.t1